VRFVTSYPGDFTDDILAAMRDVPKICPYLHIPAQSGSDTVLRRMRRQYTVSQYVDLLDRARDYVPHLAVASDFIVGFSGETEEDHLATMQLIERCRFKNIFVFKYSARPGTVADRRMEDDVPDEVKRRRNIELLNLQERISAAANMKLIGSTVEVLVEGFSKTALKAQEAEQTRGEEIGWRMSDQLVARTPQDQIVVFSGTIAQIGQFASVRIVSATALTLHGELIGLSSCPHAQARSIEAKPLNQQGANDRGNNRITDRPPALPVLSASAFTANRQAMNSAGDVCCGSN
jgi:tRNA-2-methylthio-N6-dimethylallyladenosine synthase